MPDTSLASAGAGRYRFPRRFRRLVGVRSNRARRIAPGRGYRRARRRPQVAAAPDRRTRGHAADRRCRQRVRVFEWIADAPYVLLGSHSDSQPYGGRFDGAFGVLAALHAAAQLDRAVAAGRSTDPQRGGCRLVQRGGCPLPAQSDGQRVHTGKFTAAEALTTTDLSGTTVAEALAANGMVGTDRAPVTAAYAEVHIEQGRVLESTGTNIGLVTETGPSASTPWWCTANRRIPAPHRWPTAGTRWSVLPG